MPLLERRGGAQWGAPRGQGRGLIAWVVGRRLAQVRRAEGAMGGVQAEDGAVEGIGRSGAQGSGGSGLEGKAGGQQRGQEQAGGFEEEEEEEGEEGDGEGEEEEEGVRGR